MTKNDMLALRVINHFNLDGPVIEDKDRDADLLITKAMGRFCSKYSKELKSNYTFIIKYDNDIYSALSYIIVANCGGIVKRNLDIRLMGTPKTSEEKQFFNRVKTITYHKAKKAKKAILITGFHPICNVINLAQLSKEFIEIANPLERFVPDTFRVTQSYWLQVAFAESLDKRVKLSNWFTIDEWNKFFSLPLSVDNLPQVLPNIDYDVPVCVFSFDARHLNKEFFSEEDAKYFDFILESSKEGNLHLYDVRGLSEENIEFLKCNLSPYIDYRNQPMRLNFYTPSTDEKGQFNYFYPDDYHWDTDEEEENNE